VSKSKTKCLNDGIQLMAHISNDPFYQDKNLLLVLANTIIAHKLSKRLANPFLLLCKLTTDFVTI